jgi:hypothetical protein
VAVFLGLREATVTTRLISNRTTSVFSFYLSFSLSGGPDSADSRRRRRRCDVRPKDLFEVPESVVVRDGKWWWCRAEVEKREVRVVEWFRVRKNEKAVHGNTVG